MANRSKINAQLAHAAEQAKVLQVTLDIPPDTFIDDDHLDPIWYGGEIASLTYKGYEVSIEVHGEVSLFGKVNGKRFSYKEEDGRGAMDPAASDALRNAFNGDKALQAALDSGDVEYGNNNWIEAFVKEPGEEEFDTSCGFLYEDSLSVLDAACDVAGWINILEAEYIKEQPAPSLDALIQSASARAAGSGSENSEKAKVAEPAR